MKDKRPVNLDLTTIRFPITAITSILHRISGVLLFIAIPFVLWALQTSLHSDGGFETVKHCLASGVGKFFLWAILSAIMFHLIAGIRHLIMDLGVGEGKTSGPLGSKLVIIISAIVIVFLGVWVWA